MVPRNEGKVPAGHADEALTLTEDTELAAGLLNAGNGKVRKLKTEKRVQLSFTNVPETVKSRFADEAQKRGLGMKEFLYHCMRAGGVDLPPDADMDARRR